MYRQHLFYHRLHHAPCPASKKMYDIIIGAWSKCGCHISAEYNADLYHENLLGIPFLARVGSDDKNIPPENLRTFCRLLKENGWMNDINTSSVNLNEVAGKVR